MGLRYRKRTKGKNGWLNFSWSDKHGLNASATVKVGPFTWNSGNGKTTRKRITTNFGGGWTHVSYDPKQWEATVHSPSPQSDNHPVVDLSWKLVFQIVYWLALGIAVGYTVNHFTLLAVIGTVAWVLVGKLLIKKGLL